MAIRVLHTADWHIGSFPGPEINGENGRFLDVQDILNQFVTAAEREDPDFILIAGDVFHQAKVWSDRGLKEQSLCVNILRKLADIALVLVMRGTPNHDSEEQFRTLETALAGNDRISIVTKPGIDFYTGKSGQFLQVACIPGFDKALFDAVNDTAESDSVFYSRELVKLVQEMSQQVNPRVPSILAAHYTIGGANMESGQTALFSEVDPTFAQDTLQQSPFSLCCFGHIHKPQALEKDRIIYAGALEPVDRNDTGPHGYIRGEVSEAGVRTQWIPCAGREYIHLEIHVDGSDTEGSVRERIRKCIDEQGNENIYKITLTGKRNPDIKFDANRIAGLGNILETVDETCPAYDIMRLLEENRENLLGQYISRFAGCREGSLEYEALCEGIDVLLAGRD